MVPVHSALYLGTAIAKLIADGFGGFGSLRAGSTELVTDEFGGLVYDASRVAVRVKFDRHSTNRPCGSQYLLF